MIQLPDSFSYIRGRETLARAQVLKRSWPFVLDLGVAAIGLACFYGVVVIARYWFGHSTPEIVISQSPRALPLYALLDRSHHPRLFAQPDICRGIRLPGGL